MRPDFGANIRADDGEKIFGEGPYRLLLGVDRLGSLNAAAKELGMAWSKANRIMHRAERLLGVALTQKRIGGPGGGGSELTPAAQDLIARYEAFRSDCAAAVEASFAKHFQSFLRPSLGCAVMAAGQSRRFGGNKLLAQLGGKAVLEHTLDALPVECFQRIAVIISNPEVSALCRAKGFPIREYPGGAQSASIREAVAEMMGTDGCMFVNGDQPLLRPESLRKMAAAFAETPKRVIRLAYAGTAASPVILPSSAYPALMALEGESGGMLAIHGGNWKIRTVEASHESELWDVDDEDALRRCEENL